jgi:hypothetical protein
MDDAQRYRMNAAECILAGERCGPAYRDLTFALAESWLSLARQQEAMDELLVIWSKAHSATLAAPSRQSFHARSSPAPLASPARCPDTRFFTNLH